MTKLTNRISLPRLAALSAFVGATLAGCGGNDPVRIVVLGTTDIHGNLVPYEYATDEPTQASLAQTATLIDSIRRAEPNVILVDSGDLLQGTALDEYQAQVGRDPVHPVVAAMNLLEYDASAIGNHEFNYGIEFLRESIEPSSFPFLAANITIADTDSLAFQPYEIVEREGIRVGLLGLTTPGVLIWDRTHVLGRLDFHDMVDAAAEWVPRIREAGADVVIVHAHAGLGPGSSYGFVPGVPEENSLARMAVEVPGIDAIFAGHTVEAIGGELIGGSMILHAGRAGDHLAVAELTVRRTSAGVEVERSGRVIPTRGVPPHPDIVALVDDAHTRTVAWLGEPIGYTPDRWSSENGRLEDTPIADLVARVQAEVTGADLSAASVFRTGVEFGPGSITRRDILGLYVYPNTLRAIEIDGAQLKAYLERSALYYRTLPGDELVNDSVPGYNFDLIDGVEYVIDLSRPAGDRIRDLVYQGTPVAETDRFTLALNNYRQTGGGGFDMIADAPVIYADETDVAGRIVEWVSARDTLRWSDVFTPNWELQPMEEVRRLARPSG